ncbi:MAG: IS200/IS605 family transposase, partial [Muribaculaceae bacterium]
NYKMIVMSYIKALFHIVICTHNREMSISEEHKRELYKYIFGVIKNYNCTLVRINGIPNHIHMLVDINSGVAISNFIRDIKRSSSVWIKESRLFPLFNGWGREYGAFACSYVDCDKVIEYIKNQEAHHVSEVYEMEYRNLIMKNGLTYYDTKD